jgi:hypothetical protein
MSTQPTLITVPPCRAARASYPLSRVLERHASVAPMATTAGSLTHKNAEPSPPGKST